MKCEFNEGAHLQSTYRSGVGVACADGMEAEFKGTEVSGLKASSQQCGSTSSPGAAPRGFICVAPRVHLPPR